MNQNTRKGRASIRENLRDAEFPARPCPASCRPALPHHASLQPPALPLVGWVTESLPADSEPLPPIGRVNAEQRARVVGILLVTLLREHHLQGALAATWATLKSMLLASGLQFTAGVAMIALWVVWAWVG